jgi:hypothetical protein
MSRKSSIILVSLNPYALSFKPNTATDVTLDMEGYKSNYLDPSPVQTQSDTHLPYFPSLPTTLPSPLSSPSSSPPSSPPIFRATSEPPPDITKQPPDTTKKPPDTAKKFAKTLRLTSDQLVSVCWPSPSYLVCELVSLSLNRKHSTCDLVPTLSRFPYRRLGQLLRLPGYFFGIQQIGWSFLILTVPSPSGLFFVCFLNSCHMLNRPHTQIRWSWTRICHDWSRLDTCWCCKIVH